MIEFEVRERERESHYQTQVCNIIIITAAISKFEFRTEAHS